ncbi:MAG: hypothetical protein NT027_07140 [Proteobacteria bacterium]|nr:hypothetical protein [Pseudomonadota bacterium]
MSDLIKSSFFILAILFCVKLSGCGAPDNSPSERSKNESPKPPPSEDDANNGSSDGGKKPQPSPTPSLDPNQKPPSAPPSGPGSSTSFDWRQHIKLDDVPTYSFAGNTFGSKIFKDIMEHTPSSQRFLTSGRSTQAHESQHGLVSIMRNATREDDGFFYYENGKGSYVVQPKKVMAKVKDYIGPKFRQEAKSRYDLYLVQQATSWPEVLYLFDEWNAYVATSRSAIELVESGQWDNGNSDPFDGLADFLYFCSASIMALQEYDPQYLEKNTQFKATYAMLVEQSQKYIAEGTKLNLFKNSVSLRRLEMLKRDEESAKIRKTMETYMGSEWFAQFMNR